MLIKSGSLDGIAGGLNRPQLFWKYYHRDRNAEKGRSFLDGCEVPSLREYSRSVCLSDEIDTLELFLRGTRRNSLPRGRRATTGCG